MAVPEFREEAAAAFEARRELGSEYEHAVLESFVERAEQAIDRRVDARLARYGVGKPPEPKAKHDSSHLTLAICSLVFGIPLTAISAGIVGLPGLILVWTGIVLVNFAYAIRKQPPPPSGF
jgi:cytochrome P450